MSIARSFCPLVLLLACFTCIDHAIADDAAPDMRVRMTLRHAMMRGDAYAPGEPSIIVNLRRTDGVWERIWGTAGNYNRKEHFGRVVDERISDEDMRFELSLTIQGDPWVPGGRLTCVAELEKQKDGTFAGTYEGKIRDIPIKGEVTAIVPDLGPLHHEPAKPGEHPRLLFRASDLPALREKAKTPFGKLAVAQMNDSAANFAMRYALTGEKQYAREAAERVKAIIPDRDDGDKRVRSRWWSWRIEQAAIAYDLCYHVWDEDFRKEVADYLNEAANTILYNRGVLDNHISWNYGGSHAPTMLWSPGVAALAIAGEKGPEPQRPAPPHLISEAKGKIAPISDLKPGKGVKAVAFKNDAMPGSWIYAGPFPVDAEPLATDAQRGSARPAAGDKLTNGKLTREWRPIAMGKGLYKGSYTGNRLGLELTGPAGVQTHTNSYYYTVLKNDRARWARVHTGHGAVEMYLAGVRLTAGDVVHLEPGMYPWLVTGPIGEMNPWGKSFAMPKLIELDEKQVKEAVEEAQAAYADTLAYYELDHDQWKRTGGANVAYLKTAEAAHHVMDIVLMELLGEGGFMSGADMMQAMDGVTKYALMHRNVTGRDAGAYDEVTDYLPRKLFVQPLRPDRKPIGQEINGPPDFVCSQYPESGRDAAGETFAPLFPLIRDEWKPAALWAWNYHTGGSAKNEEGLKQILAVRRGGYAYGRSYGTFNTHPIYAFINYPLDMKPRSPEGIMPRHWQAPAFGFYGFRNNWSGGDDQFITQFFSSTYGGGAGTLRIAGLGHVWSHGLGTPATRRFGENVVQMFDTDTNTRARGKVTYLRTENDGSGAVSIDLSRVYSAPVIDERGRPRSLYERYGHIPIELAFGDSGMTGMRAMAVDYSGASGAPCMIVMVDRIRGNKRPAHWAWQLEATYGSAGKSAKHPKKEGWITFKGREFDSPRNGQLLFTESRPIEGDERIELHEDGFTFRQDGASMRATFVTPQRPRMEFAEKAQYRDGAKGNVSREASKAIFAEGRDAFFVILTIQNGEPPKVTWKGKGLEAVATVGGQTVRFDGKKIVLER